MSCDFIELAVPGVRTLRPYQPGKPESEVRREYGLSEVIKLASNENPLGPSPKAVAAVQQILREAARYPDGNGFALKSALAEKFQVDSNRITLGNGSNDVLELIVRAFVTPQEAVVVAQHSFAVYALATQAVGAELRVAQANPPSHEMAYGHDLDAMAALVSDNTRVVFIANPNNPTGTWLQSAPLEAFIQALPERVLVVVDEAYSEYVDLPDYPDARAWLDKYPNLIVTRTFSKAYGLAALRVGYALSNPQVADLLNRVRQPFNVNAPALAAAVAALGDEEYLARSRECNRRGMAQLQQGFAELGLRWLPSVGNFLCVDVARPGSEVFQALLRKGVIVRPVDNYGLPNFVRITIGTEPENRRLLEQLTEVCDAA